MSNHQFNQPIQHARIYDLSMVQDHVSIHIENMLRGMPATLPEHSIFRVRQQLRKVNEKAYDPEILAIGPYHYGNDKFKLMEEQKLRYLQQLLKRRNEGSVDRYVLALRKLEQRARNCYAETVDLTQEKFLAMMLIDGCFIVEFFRKFKMKKLRNKNDPVMHQRGIEVSIRSDLLLLENQLPFFVLSKLYDLTKGPGEPREFSVLAMMYFNFEPGGPGQNWTMGSSEHLLHLYHTWCTSCFPQTTRLNCKPPREFISSATELKEAGIRFRAARGEQLSDIKFENGTLEITVLKVTDHTESKFRNLIAFEQHRQRRDITYFTDYVRFMDYLINSSKDVKVLRRAGIIKNYLGDDDVVAQMFNKMCDNVTSSGSSYSKILQNLNAHCAKRRNVWMAKLRGEYFHSPWAFLSVLAAIVLLLLTAAQTVFTILSYTK